MVKTGLDILCNDIKELKNRRIALIANQTSVSGGLKYSWDLFISAGVNLKRLFSPEHGLFSTEQDQVPVSREPAFPFEIVSLYGDSYDSLSPLDQYLSDIDTVIFDIQDVGSRYYTYINTLVLFMKRLHKKDIELIILDRPNPLGGVEVEGPILQDGYQSFVGVLPVPVRHGLTAGELALFTSDHFGLDINCRVIAMEGWQRTMFFSNTGLFWIPPSPNMPTSATAILYPGMCLIEGTNISEGRGTTTPFELLGAPFIDPHLLSEILNGADLKGIYFRPIYFRPTFHKYAGEIIGGIGCTVTDAGIFKPFATGVSVVSAIRKCYSEFRFLEGVYEFNSNHPAFDLLTGGGDVRKMIIAGKEIGEITQWWGKDESSFKEIKKQYHRY